MQRQFVYQRGISLLVEMTKHRFEQYSDIERAIEPKKELKKWSRKKKEALIKRENPNRNSLNKSVWEF